MGVHDAFGCPSGTRRVTDHEWIVERDSCKGELVVRVGSSEEVMSGRVSGRLAHDRYNESLWYWFEPTKDLIQLIKSRNCLALVHSVAVNEQDARSHLLQPSHTAFQA